MDTPGHLRTLSRVALVGDQPYRRELLWDWLNDDPGIRSIVPVVTNGHPTPFANGTRDIDVVVGIIDHRHDPALDTCRALLQADPDRHFVAVLTDPDDRTIQRAVETCARAITAAASGPAALSHAVDAATNGAVWLDPALSHLVMPRLGSVPTDNDYGLTPAEVKVAACFLEGLTNHDIAEYLGVSDETVKTHVRNIYGKLDVRKRTDAAAKLRPWLRPTQGPDTGRHRGTARGQPR